MISRFLYLGVQRRLEVSSAGVDESAGGKANSPSSFSSSSSSSSFVCFENFLRLEFVSACNACGKPKTPAAVFFSGRDEEAAAAAEEGRFSMFHTRAPSYSSGRPAAGVIFASSPRN